MANVKIVQTAYVTDEDWNTLKNARHIVCEILIELEKKGIVPFNSDLACCMVIDQQLGVLFKKIGIQYEEE